MMAGKEQQHRRRGDWEEVPVVVVKIVKETWSLSTTKRREKATQKHHSSSASSRQAFFHTLIDLVFLFSLLVRLAGAPAGSRRSPSRKQQQQHRESNKLSVVMPSAQDYYTDALVLLLVNAFINILASIVCLWLMKSMSLRTDNKLIAFIFMLTICQLVYDTSLLLASSCILAGPSGGSDGYGNCVTLAFGVFSAAGFGVVAWSNILCVAIISVILFKKSTSHTLTHTHSHKHPTTRASELTHSLY